MFLLIVPIAFADIAIQTDQGIYNLGNKVKVSVSVLQANSFDGLFKMALSCGSYKLQYFLTPVSLEANFRTAVAVPEVTATSQMLGNCAVIADLATNEGLIAEEKSSNNFEVTDKLTVLPVKNTITALPEDIIQVTGVINEAFGNNVLKAAAKIRLDNLTYEIDALDGKFNLTLDIPKNIKSGKHTIEISASDSKNNLGSSSIGLDITAVPSYIKTEASSNNLLPGSKISIVSSLYDQADDLINASLDLELTHSRENKIFRKIVQSGEKIEYEFSQYAEPGLYILISSYKNLQYQNSINITTVREVRIKFENETVFVENIGNIPFEDELTFFLESEAKKYPILKKIRVNPGKILDIDLSKEVPLGIYNVLLPIKEGLGPIKEKINETLQNAVESLQGKNSLQNENVLASGVTIRDNRPVYKKVASGISSISGTLVGADGVLAKNPVIAPAILISILGILVFRYGRKPIMRLIRGKKDDDKEEKE